MRLILVVIGAGELSNINHKHENYRLVGELTQTIIPLKQYKKNEQEIYIIHIKVANSNITCYYY